MSAAERYVELSLFPDIKPDRPVGYIVPSVFVGSNAELVAAVAPMYLTGSVMDCTYGEGKWWTLFRPTCSWPMTCTSSTGSTSPTSPNRTRRTTPCASIRPTSQTAGSSRRPCRTSVMRSASLRPPGARRLWAMIGAGMVECARVLKPGGFLLVKCMDFVADGLTLGHRKVLDMATACDGVP